MDSNSMSQFWTDQHLSKKSISVKKYKMCQKSKINPKSNFSVKRIRRSVKKRGFGQKMKF